MKTSVITFLALGLLALASVANANLIGLFADQEGTICKADLPLYSAVDVYMIAQLSDVASITAAEFRIGDLPDPTGAAVISQIWNTPLVIGNPLLDGVSLAFSEPLAGPYVALGHLNIFVTEETWPGNDSKWCIVATNDSNNLVVVDDAYNAIPVEGWCFVANCIIGGEFGDCPCGDEIPTEETSWGSLKALY